MAKQSFTPLFERNLAEQRDMVASKLASVQQDNLSRGLYNSFRDSTYNTKEIVIRVYADHREVVKIDATTGATQTLKVIL